VPERPDDAEDFAAKYESNNPISRRLIDGYFSGVASLIATATKSLPDAAVTHEVGCAEGNSTVRVRGLLPKGHDFSASELIQEQVEVARAANPGLDIVQADATAMPQQDDSFDFVFILEVLEHVPEPAVVLAEMQRIIKPGGYLIAGVPREPLWRVLNMARGKYITGLGNTPGHIQHWSARGFLTLVASDFGPVEESVQPLPWTIALSRNGG
jgi:ubiquinone/menaquinone biosynthesis C-methylase UbiE